MRRNRFSDKCIRSECGRGRKRNIVPSREQEFSRGQKNRRMFQERNYSPNFLERSTPGTTTSFNSDLLKLAEVLSNILQLSSRMQDNYYLNTIFVPEFDPADKKLSASEWLEIINICGILYNLNEKAKFYVAVCRLRGNAKLWFDAVHNSILSWSSFSCSLVTQFPSAINFGKLLEDAANYKSDPGQDLQAYCFTKLGKLNKLKLGLPEDKLVDFVVHGIHDKRIRTTVLAAGLKTLHALNLCLSSFDESREKEREVAKNRTRNIMLNIVKQEKS